MRTKAILLISLLLGMASTVLAQVVTIEGSVKLGSREHAEMALVALYADSASNAQPQAYTYTDRRGYYLLHLDSLTAQSYTLRVTYLGYITTEKVITPSREERQSFKLDFLLEADREATQLEAVTVTASQRRGIDKRSYHFDRDAIRRAQNCLDLALTLPQIKAEPSTGHITSATGEAKPLLLINGRRATNEELRAIPPGKIIRIDYFDIAPQRYDTRGSVIDVITKPLDNGHHAGVELGVAPVMTEGSGSLYYNYNTGRHQVKVFTRSFVRHTHQGRYEEQDMTYMTTQPYRYHSEGTSQIRLLTSALRASYAYNVPDKQYLEVSLSSTFERSHLPQSYEATMRAGALKQQRRGESDSKEKVFTPVVDVYYDRVLGSRGNRIYANAVYTHNDTRTSYDFTERTQTNPLPELEDELEARTRKHSLIAQVEYAQPLGRGWLYLGSQAMYSKARFRLEGTSVGNSTDSQYQWRDRSYITWETRLGKKLYLRLSPQINVHYASAHKGLESSERRVTLNPRLLVGYTLRRGHRLRLEVETENIIPSLGQTTAVIRKIREGLYARNNPQLGQAYSTTARLYHSWSSDYIDLSSTLIYNHTSRDHTVLFEPEMVGGQLSLVQYMANSRYSQYWQYKGSVSIKPLGNESLILRLYAKPIYSYIQYTDSKHVGRLSLPTGFSLSYRHGNWGVQADADLPYRNKLYSYFISSSSWYTALSTDWSKGPWSLRLALEYLSAETSRSNNHDFVRLQQSTHEVIRDNHWKASIALAYYFSSGKRYKASRSLENEDNDRGTF